MVEPQVASSRPTVRVDAALSSAPIAAADADDEHASLVSTDHEGRDRPPRGANREVKEALLSMLSSWASRKFMSGCAILFPLAVTCYVSWWFLTYFDSFFSPLFEAVFGFHIFGLGFLSSMAFIFFSGVFVSSWIGAWVLSLGEWIIQRVPLVKHVYSASKQISTAISPDQNSRAFKECVIIKHPRKGEFAFGFITSEVCLQLEEGDLELFSVYVPTNHLYVGDVVLIAPKDVIRPRLSVREGIEIVVSGGMSMPSLIGHMPTTPRGP
eukprot:jgi/Chlat1/1865/Chrsp141S02196